MFTCWHLIQILKTELDAAPGPGLRTSALDLMLKLELKIEPSIQDLIRDLFVPCQLCSISLSELLSSQLQFSDLFLERLCVISE